MGDNIVETEIIGNDLPEIPTEASGPVKEKVELHATGYFTIRLIAAPFTEEHRVYGEEDGIPISLWHDIPLYASEDCSILHMVVTAPRWTNGQFKIKMDEPFNPIAQDMYKGKLRFVRNCFPHHGHIWNYGILPQTWENPDDRLRNIDFKGDNYPLDVVEIGEEIGYVGQVKLVKVLGIMGVLSNDTIDWKVVAVDINSPGAERLKTLESVEVVCPGLLRATNEWFRIYEIPEGKRENFIAFSGEWKGTWYTKEVISQCHRAWRKLLYEKKPRDGISRANGTLTGSPYVIDQEDLPLPDHEMLMPMELSTAVDKWFFIDPYHHGDDETDKPYPYSKEI